MYAQLIKIILCFKIICPGNYKSKKSENSVNINKSFHEFSLFLRLRALAFQAFGIQIWTRAYVEFQCQSRPFDNSAKLLFVRMKKPKNHLYSHKINLPCNFISFNCQNKTWYQLFLYWKHSSAYHLSLSPCS